MKNINVLITAASRRVSLVRNFRVAVKEYNGKVITVDYNTESPALFFGHNHYTVPLVSSPDYLDSIEKICKKEKIKLIIPTIDNELRLWAKNRKRFEEQGIIVSISDEDTVDMCNDKWKTYLFFNENKIPFPKTYLPEQTSSQMRFPLFIKPREGRGSVKAFKIENKDELFFFKKYIKEPIIQEYLYGKEFTVDLFFSRDSRLISMVPRYRLVIRSGVSDRGLTFNNKKLTELIMRISEKIKFQGAINIQGKIHENEIKFFEINPRFSGGIQLTTAAGPNFSVFLIKEILGEKLKPEIGKYEKELLMTSYEDSIFINKKGKVTFFFFNNIDILPKSKHKKI